MGYFDSEHPTFLAEPVGPRDHVRGPADAAVTLVEYGDFACPFCGAAYGTLKALLAERPDLRLVFRANPRSHLFPHADMAAQAAEAASAQGKFWEMHDLLFENQSKLSRDEMVRLAGVAGLDVERFTRELDAGTYKAVVHAQEISGWHSHVLSTPTFFVNGVRFEDAISSLPAAIAKATREQGLAHKVFRDVRIHSTDDRRRQAISVGPHQFSVDLPAAEEGRDAGPGPYDLLGAALGACTAMTIQWAADRQRIPLRHVDVRLTQSRGPTGHLFRLELQLDGDLNEEQRLHLQHAADHCPVSRTLRHPIEIDERVTLVRVVDDAGEQSFPASDPPVWTLGREPKP